MSTISRNTCRVGPVQVPLVFIERCPDVLAEIGVVGEVAGRIVGEDFDQRALVMSSSSGLSNMW